MSRPTGVGATAVFVAAARALESEREDRLFDDPWARAFVRASGWDPPAEGTSGLTRDQLVTWMSARTKFLDDFAVESVAGGCAQVVFLGAGLDTRAFRLRWPAPVAVFELDTPDMLEFKMSVLADTAPSPPATRVPVAVDLREDWPAALRGAGFRDDVPTAWILEGLLLYLTPEDVDTLMNRVACLSAPGSTVGATLTTIDFIAAVQDLPGIADSPLSATEWREMLRSDGPEDPVAWFDRYGWRAQAFATVDLARRYGRDATPLEGEPVAGDRWLVSAVRK